MDWQLGDDCFCFFLSFSQDRAESALEEAAKIVDATEKLRTMSEDLERVVVSQRDIWEGDVELVSIILL